MTHLKATLPISAPADAFVSRQNETQALGDCEPYFHQLAEVIPHMVWTRLPDGRFDYCNQHWRDYTGQSLADSQRLGWLGCVHPEYADRVEKTWKQALATGELYEMEYPLRAQDGTYRWHLERALPMRDATGKILRWLGTCTNVHEKRLTTEIFREMNKVLENRVGERTKALREVNEQMESFCYTVSHDLRAPLRAMRSFTQVLLEDHAAQLNPSGQDFLQRVSTAAERMDLLIQDLLEYSRLGRVELTLGPVSIETVIESALLDLRSEIRAKKAVVQVVKPMPLVRAQETLLQQVLINLLSNALKFVAENIPPRIKIWTEIMNGRVRVFIRDHGIGIPQEYHERIFRVFERLHGVRTYPGTGIGLAIVQKGVERMNGTVGLESQPGQGSCFWLDLPQA